MLEKRSTGTIAMTESRYMQRPRDSVQLALESLEPLGLGQPQQLCTTFIICALATHHCALPADNKTCSCWRQPRRAATAPSQDDHGS